MGDGIVTVGRRRATPRSTRAYRPSGDCLNITMLQGTLLFASLWRRLRNSSLSIASFVLVEQARNVLLRHFTRESVGRFTLSQSSTIRYTGTMIFSRHSQSSIEQANSVTPGLGKQSSSSSRNVERMVDGGPKATTGVCNGRSRPSSQSLTSKWLTGAATDRTR